MILAVTGFVCPANEGLVSHPVTQVTMTAAQETNCTDTAAIVAASVAPAATVACGCSASRGPESFFIVPAEQAAATWCDLGMWAPVLLWSLLYIYHGFACSISGDLATFYSREVATRQHNVMLERMREELRNPVKKETALEDMPLFQKVRYDPVPRPTDVTAYGRVFKV